MSTSSDIWVKQLSKVQVLCGNVGRTLEEEKTCQLDLACPDDSVQCLTGRVET